MNGYKYLSFKIIVLCLLLPPVLYITTLMVLENSLHDRFAEEIEDVYMGDTRLLFNGQVRLKDAVNQNIDRYLTANAFVSWGAKATVTVATKKGLLIYPGDFEDQGTLWLHDPIQTAAENFKLMNEGLSLKLDVRLAHGSRLANAILTVYILTSVLILYFFHRAALHKTLQADMTKDKAVAGLKATLAQKLGSLEQEREKLGREIGQIKKDLKAEKHKSSLNEEEMIQEIISLEAKLEKNEAAQDARDREIAVLKEEINRVDKKKAKDIPNVRKRFQALYKGIHMEERALKGFVDLSDDIKIKAEEVIHRLNENAQQVPIKRKVFGKHDRRAILETLFAYKGRMYFCKTKANRVEILAIGTKNTQDKDLEYLERLQINRG